MTKYTGKTLVLGLDGATFRIIDPLIQKNALPNLKKLISKGYRAELESVLPPITGPAWCTFMTGKQPANHSILDFTFQEAEEKRKVFNYSLIDGPTIFEILESEGISQAVLNVPGTWPAPKISGPVVTGLLSPDKNKVFFPETLKQELNDNGIEYRVDADDFPLGMEKEFIKDMIEITKIQKNTINYFLEKKNPTVMFYVLRSTDSVSHNFWKYYDKSHPLYQENADYELKNAIENIYIESDKVIGELIKKHNFDNILIMSDHGFGPCKSQILLNNFFIDKKYIEFKENSKKSVGGTLEKFGLTYNTAKKILQKLHLFNFIKSLFSAKKRAEIAETFLSFKDIDWTTTKAFSAGNGGQIFINKKAFQSKESVKEFRESLRNELLEIKHPNTKEKLFRDVKYKEEVFVGKYAKNAPDLYPLATDESNLIFSSISSTRNLVDNVFENSGEHRMDGIFILYGKGIKQGRGKAHIVDVAPTLLHLLGLPVHSGMDGKVIKEAFQEKREIKSKTYSTDSKDKVTISDKENEKIKQKLKGMGYFT